MVQDVRGSSKTGTIGCARHCLLSRYRPCEAPAVLGDGRHEAPDSPRNGACAATLLQHVGRRKAALDAAAAWGDVARSQALEEVFN
ncbi:hypothetical protein HAX54_004120 [Datura stramonium]|uniref:Uncharacterized protein n=1 Tax=Datura stramonium TaxID=4076 RepID=A0ABS8T6I9_DATST|nr:hypothetical protein [Datura stramonium]